MPKPWGRVGIAAQLLFTASWLVAPLWQGPAYSVVAHSISDMYAVTAPGGAVMAAVLTVCGAATIGYAVAGLRPALRPAGWPGTVGWVLLTLSIFGLGDLLSPFERLACRAADPGCSPADQVANSGGALDATLSTLGVVLLIPAGFFLWSAFRRSGALRATAPPVLVLSIAVAVAFVLAAALPAGVGGLTERLVALTGAALIVSTALPIAGRDRAGAGRPYPRA